MHQNVTNPEIFAEKLLSAKQQTFISSLLLGKSIVDACSACGCDNRTGHRWLKLPEVRAVLVETKQALYDATLDALMLGTRVSLDVLSEIRDDTTAPQATRLRAAQILLEQSLSLFKINTLEEKLRELEDLLRQGGSRRLS